MSALEEAWALLQQLMMGQRARLFSIAGEYGLAPMQALALKGLEPGKPRPMSELAQHLRCDNSNVTGIVDRLEARGLVERRPGERDRRVKMLEVTDEGAKVRRELHAKLTAPPEPLTRLSEEGAAELRDLLARALRQA